MLELSLDFRLQRLPQVDLFGIKDIGPSHSTASTLEVFAVVRLMRSSEYQLRASNSSKVHEKTLHNAYVTKTRRIEALKAAPGVNASDYPWKEKAVLRFPLPDTITRCYPTLGTFIIGLLSDCICKTTTVHTVDDADMLHSPPSAVKISLYSKQFFVDTKLGEVYLALDSVTTDRYAIYFISV